MITVHADSGSGCDDAARGFLQLLSWTIISWILAQPLWTSAATFIHDHFGDFCTHHLHSPGFLRLFPISMWWKNNGCLRNTSCVHLMYRDAVIYYTRSLWRALLTSLFFCSNVIDTRCTAVLFSIVYYSYHKHVHYTDVHIGAAQGWCLLTQPPGSQAQRAKIDI